MCKKKNYNTYTQLIVDDDASAQPRVALDIVLTNTGQ